MKKLFALLALVAITGCAQTSGLNDILNTVNTVNSIKNSNPEQVTKNVVRGNKKLNSVQDKVDTVREGVETMNKVKNMFGF